MKLKLSVLWMILWGLWANLLPTTVFAQCSRPMQSGHQVVTTLQGCVPLEVNIKNLYRYATEDAVFTVNWGDGTVTVLSGADDPIDDGLNDPIYTPDFIHTYTESTVDCGYTIIITATNACTPAADARMELNVSLWDTDQVGLAIAPVTLRVCQGFAAGVSFQDVSDWNCYPRDFNENNLQRYINWAFIGGTMQIPGVIPGTQTTVTPVANPGTNSDVINVPANDPTNPGNPYPIGHRFDVRLNNWNGCNLYPDGEEPVTADGGIEIVPSPVPAYTTRLTDAGGAVTTEFCIGDLIYFQNTTANIAGANFTYQWEFFDGPNLTDPLLETRTNRNPTLSYETGGPKLVRLRIQDENTVGNCYGEIQQIVNVAPTAIAQINVNPPALCANEDNAGIYEFTFEDVSTGVNANTSFKWFFYNENGVLTRSVPSGAAFSATQLGPFTEQYTNAGIYEVRLQTRDNASGCISEDRRRVIVYNNPVVDFEAINACEGSEVLFIDKSTLTSINANSLNRWEWDFDYDGITFNADLSYNDTRPDTTSYELPVGSHNVALRVWEDQRSCFTIINKTVEVHPSPLAAFAPSAVLGCSPLALEINNTIHATQPSDIAWYRWSIKYEGDEIDSLRQYPADPQFGAITDLTFTNNRRFQVNYQLSLQAESIYGCRFESDPTDITVNPTLKPGFGYINYDPFGENCSPLSIDFQIDAETRSLSPASYEWTVTRATDLIHAETIAGSSTNFNHGFTASGNMINRFNITLSADVASSCMQDSTLVVAINPAPQALIQIDTLQADCEAFVFGIHAMPQGLPAYHWELSENGLLQTLGDPGQFFVHTISRPASGNAGVQVEIDLATSNFSGCHTTAQPVELFVPARNDFTAIFAADPIEQWLPDRTVNLTTFNTITELDYRWTLGDGTTSEETQLSHTYALYGDYEIELTVSEDNCSKTEKQLIRIHPIPPVTDFSFDPPSGCVPLTVSFTNLSQYADASSYRWHFGTNQGTSSAENPIYTYHEPGIYSVRLEASNATGTVVAEEKFAIIEVFANPFANFSVRPLTVKLPNDPVYITNQSRGASDFIWDFGDGTKRYEFEPVHAYQDSGVFDISLIAITSAGCTDTLVNYRAVEAKQTNMARIPNAFIPNLDGPNGGYINGSEMNTVFYPITEGVVARRLQIFNRWGEQLFETEDLNVGWDGYYKGRLCPQGVYVYKLYFKYIDGKEDNRVGDVTLLR